MTLTKASITVSILLAILIDIAMAEELDDANLSAMGAAARSYANAWLSNDADAVMATFVDEPVLSPSDSQLPRSQILKPHR